MAGNFTNQRDKIKMKLCKHCGNEAAILVLDQHDIELHYPIRLCYAWICSTCKTEKNFMTVKEVTKLLKKCEKSWLE